MLAQGRDGLSKTAYERHQPEQTLLYQLVEAHYPALVDQLAQQGKSLPVKPIANTEVSSPAERHAARACPALSGMTWAQRLKRVFNTDKVN